jgi:hypothetical protein
MLAVEDMKASSYGKNPRVKYVMGGWAIGGYTAATYNYIHATGSGSNLANCNPASPIGSTAPITLFDYYAVAPYFAIGSANFTTYIGTNASPGTYTTSWISDVQTYGLNSSQALADIQSYVSLLQTDNTGDSTSTLETDVTGIGNLVATGTVNNGGVAYGKRLIGYEGGFNTAWSAPLYITALSCSTNVVSVTATGASVYTTNEYVQINNTSVSGWNIIGQVASTGNTFTIDVASCPGGSPTSTNYQGYYGSVTPATQGFILATTSSVSWANAQALFFNYFLNDPHLAMPGVYVQISTEWGFAFPDTFGATTTEGNGLFPSWTYMGSFNQRFPFLLNRDLDPASNDNSPAFIAAAA